MDRNTALIIAAIWSVFVAGMTLFAIHAERPGDELELATIADIAIGLGAWNIGLFVFWSLRARTRKAPRLPSNGKPRG